MATLAAISFTLVGGIAVFGVTLAAFGCAVKRRSVFVAARCVARPRNVIYNPKPIHPCQNRGDPTLGWIMWVMRLTYDTMLRGIPGTGTRDGGLTGALLKVNLDGIVLLRFHHLCLRVCFLATILYMAVVLPLFKTAQCSRIGRDDEEYDDILACQQSNLTDYQRLTLANIPTLDPPKTDRFADIFYGFFLPVHDGLLARLYIVVFCSWIVSWYCLRELTIEWGEVLAMRRVYYLEADHWSDRNEELQETLMREEREKFKRQRKAFHANNEQDDDTYMKNRDPWVPHPEQRDTVPNVELYSILVGGLPSLPTEVVNQEEVDAVFSRKQSIDWQLTVTTAFFDHCVPNQPGFSSSVAAVTILPAADQLTEAWNHWYTAASKLRRLRYIRKEIAKRRRFEIDDKAYPEDDEPGERSISTRRRKMKTDRQESTVYTDSEQKQKYFQEVLGSNTDLDVENNLLHALDFGPEQTAVYSREFALGAANLAPNGWNEGKIKRAGIDELLEMEKQAVQAVHEANQDLKLAQGRIAESSEDDVENDLSDADLERIMKTASRHGPTSGSFIEDSEREPSMVMHLNDDGSETSELLEDGTPSEGGTVPKRATSGGRLSSRSSNHSKLSRSNSGCSSGSFAEVSLELEASSHDGDIEEGAAVPPSFRRGVSAPVGTTPTKRFSLDMVNPLSARGGTNKGDTPSRFSIASAGKHMSFLNPMPMMQSLNPTPIVSTPRRVKRASITSTNLPSDLGLEAGLFMEQRNISLGNSQHGSRSNARQMRRMSGDSLVSYDSGPRSRRTPRRTRSDDNIEDEPRQKPRVRRAKSSADAKLFDDEYDLEASHSSKPDYISIKEVQRSLREEAHAAKLPDETYKDSTDAEGSNPNKSDVPESIWERLEKDKQRKSRLRAKLDTMQNLQTTPSTESGNSGSSDDSPMDFPGGGLPSLKDDAMSDQPQSKPLGAKTRRFSAGSVEGQAPPVLTPRAWKIGDEEKHDGGHNMPMPDDNQDPNRRPEVSHHKKTSFDGNVVPNLMTAINENESDGESSMVLDGRPSPPGTFHLQSHHNDLHESRRSTSSHTMLDDSLQIAYYFEANVGLRERENDEGPRRRLNTNTTDKWSKVVSIIKESDTNGETTKGRKIASGKWKVLTPRQIFWKIHNKVMQILGRSTELLTKKPDMIDELARHSSYAVVTFTSRQAAVAARHCLADSRGADRWVTVGEIPSPPLADAPVCNMSSFRGCVRPVTLSISDKQKVLRHNL
jgi:hypothetical protein